MFSLLVIAALMAAATTSPIAPRFPNGRIVGGENALIETYPYQVSLELYDSHYCGGSIISAHYVVTAGHCVEWGADAMTVRAGTSMQGEGGSIHEVKEIVRHENYTNSIYDIPLNDIALLRLEKPIVFDETKQPINLYEQDEVSAPGAISVITGWGDTGTEFPTQLQTVSVPIIAKDLCDKAYTELGGLPAGQICAAYYGVGGKDACQGDSGGPLAIKGRLAGIVSWGDGCAEAFYPGVYTEVAAYRDWINEHAKL